MPAPASVMMQPAEPVSRTRLRSQQLAPRVTRQSARLQSARIANKR
jgi:hypothetical protein